MSESTIHPFEKAGLGKAPFHFVGVEERRGPITHIDPQTGAEMTVGAPGQPMGCCAYCFTGIAECCIIRSADGREFIVGNRCVEKTSGKKSKVATDARREISRRQRERRAAAKQEELDGILADATAREKLSTMPHPIKWRAEQGDTLLNWAEWMRKNSGAAGTARTLKAIKTALAGSVA